MVKAHLCTYARLWCIECANPIWEGKKIPWSCCTTTLDRLEQSYQTHDVQYQSCGRRISLSSTNYISPLVPIFWVHNRAAPWYICFGGTAVITGVQGHSGTFIRVWVWLTFWLISLKRCPTLWGLDKSASGITRTLQMLLTSTYQSSSHSIPTKLLASNSWIQCILYTTRGAPHIQRWPSSVDFEWSETTRNACWGAFATWRQGYSGLFGPGTCQGIRQCSKGDDSGPCESGPFSACTKYTPCSLSSTLRKWCDSWLTLLCWTCRTLKPLNQFGFNHKGLLLFGQGFCCWERRCEPNSCQGGHQGHRRWYQSQ